MCFPVWGYGRNLGDASRNPGHNPHIKHKEQRHETKQVSFNRHSRTHLFVYNGRSLGVTLRGQPFKINLIIINLIMCMTL